MRARLEPTKPAIVTTSTKSCLCTEVMSATLACCRKKGSAKDEGFLSQFSSLRNQGRRAPDMGASVASGHMAVIE